MSGSLHMVVDAILIFFPHPNLSRSFQLQKEYFKIYYKGAFKDIKLKLSSPLKSLPLLQFCISFCQKLKQLQNVWCFPIMICRPIFYQLGSWISSNKNCLYLNFGTHILIKWCSLPILHLHVEPYWCGFTQA